MDEEKSFYNEFERLTAIMSEPKRKDEFRLLDFSRCPFGRSNFFRKIISRSFFLFPFFAGNRKAMKGLGIGIALLIFASFTAIHVMSSYAAITFQKAGTSIDPSISSIILAVALMFGAFMTASFADKLGRRKLNLISLFGAAMGLLSTALYLYLSSRGYELSSLSWLPVVSILFFKKQL